MSVLGELLHAGRNFGENTPQGFERYVSALMHCNRRSSLVGVTQCEIGARGASDFKAVSLQSNDKSSFSHEFSRSLGICNGAAASRRGRMSRHLSGFLEFLASMWRSRVIGFIGSIETSSQGLHRLLFFGMLQFGLRKEKQRGRGRGSGTASCAWTSLENVPYPAAILQLLVRPSYTYSGLAVVRRAISFRAVPQCPESVVILPWPEFAFLTQGIWYVSHS